MLERKWFAVAPVLVAGLVSMSVVAPAAAQSAPSGAGSSNYNPGSYYKGYGNDAYYVGNYYTNLGNKSDDKGAGDAAASGGATASGGGQKSAGP